MDTEGALHHVMVRGIERCDLFLNDEDRTNLLERLAKLVDRTGLLVFAWSLMPNHFHLLLRTGRVSLSNVMRRLLTGYAVAFNRRHRRVGHLVQNRFKSIIVEEDPYFLELIRYIHLNPVRARLVVSRRGLDTYPWCGHSGLIGTVARPWQETQEVLGRFGRFVDKARNLYRTYIYEGFSQGRRPELSGGGLVRSIGGLEKIGEFKRGRERWAHDERVLGSGEFVEQVVREQEKKTDRLPIRPEEYQKTLDRIIDEVAKRLELTRQALVSGSRRKEIVEGRAVVGYLAVQKQGLMLKLVAQTMNVSSQSIIRGLEKGARRTEEIKLNITQRK